jgi:hypothetical protein
MGLSAQSVLRSRPPINLFDSPHGMVVSPKGGDIALFTGVFFSCLPHECPAEGLLRLA